MWKILGLIAGGLLAAGLVAGFVPVSASGVSCGSAFHGSDASAVSDYSSALMGLDGGASGACSSARSTPRVLAWVLLVPGVLLAGASGVAWVRENP
jgi:hypothetical protein